jgi:RNA polymerase sigma-70 factor (ECF subfamily)
VAAEKPGEDSEAVRWDKIRAGDASAFDAFYRENVARLQGFLRILTRTTQAAEDVTQEAFVQMWHSPNGFQSARGSLRAYLFGIGRKRAAEWRRKQGTTGDARLPVEPAATENNEAAAAINDAFRRLSLEQQSLLWLREVEGQSYTELAEILDIPVGTIRSRLFAAREELRRIWHGAPGKTRNRP